MRLPCAGEVALAMVNKALHQAAALPLEATRLATGAARVSTLAQFKALLDQPAATAGQERKGTILALPGHLQAGPLTVLSSQLWRLAPVERNEANHLAQRAIERLPPAHQAEPLAALEIALRCGRLDNVAARASTLAQFKALLGQQGSAPGRNCIPGLPGHLRALPLVHLSERIRQLPRDDRHAAYQLVQGAVKQLSPAHQADPLAALLGQIDVLPRGDQRLQEFADGQEAIDALPPEFRAAPLGALLANWVSVLPRSRIHEWGVSWGRKAIGQLPPADREPHLAILDSHAPPF
jgi:hypothetical protein